MELEILNDGEFRREYLNGDGPEYVYSDSMDELTTGACYSFNVGEEVGHHHHKYMISRRDKNGVYSKVVTFIAVENKY